MTGEQSRDCESFSSLDLQLCLFPLSQLFGAFENLINPVELEVGKLPLNEHVARKVDDERMHVAYVDARPHESSGRQFNDVARAQHDFEHLMALAGKVANASDAV